MLYYTALTPEQCSCRDLLAPVYPYYVYPNGLYAVDAEETKLNFTNCYDLISRYPIFCDDIGRPGGSCCKMCSRLNSGESGLNIIKISDYFFGVEVSVYNSFIFIFVVLMHGVSLGKLGIFIRIWSSKIQFSVLFTLVSYWFTKKDDSVYI